MHIQRTNGRIGGLWLVLLGCGAVSLAGCGNSADLAKGREILATHQQELAELATTAESVDLHTSSLETQAESWSADNWDDLSTAAILASVVDEHLHGYEASYESLRNQVWAEFEEAGIAEADRSQLWDEWWQERETTADPAMLRDRLEGSIAHVSVDSQRFDTMIQQGLVGYCQAAGAVIPPGVKAQAGIAPRTIDRTYGGVRFRLAVFTEFLVSLDGSADPIGDAYDVVLEQDLIFEGRPLGLETTLHYVRNSGWSVVNANQY